LFFDIHAHVLPAVDDGAKNLEESIKLLEQLKRQGITHVMATPHFYPQEDNFEDFFDKISNAYETLNSAIENKDLPKVYLGCEMLYCRWATSSELIAHFCLSKSNHILLELTDFDIDNKFFVDVIRLKMSGYEPIIAHPERYYHAPNFRKFLRFLKDVEITVQINAESLFIPAYKTPIRKLITGDYNVILGSDTHNSEDRPPMLEKALKHIADNYGEENCKKIKFATKTVFDKIVAEGKLNA